MTKELALACSQGHKDYAKSLIDATIDWTYVFPYAASGGDLYIMSYAAQRGKITDEMWTRAIFDAIIKEYTHIIEYIIQIKGDNYATDALYTACDYGRHEIVQIILTYSYQRPELKFNRSEVFYHTCLGGNTFLMALISEEFNINRYSIKLIRRGFEGACRGGNVNAICYLIDTFSMITLDLNRGLTIATCAEQLAAVQCLIEHGASNLKSNLYRSACYRSLPIMRELLMENAPNVQNISKKNMYALFAIGLSQTWVQKNCPHLAIEIRRLRRIQYIVIFKYLNQPKCIAKMIFAFI